jgi:hypothetical protein
MTLFTKEEMEWREAINTLKRSSLNTPQKLAAKAIRKELKLFFPSVKFKVTSSAYSVWRNGNVAIGWNGGVTKEQVSKIVNKYRQDNVFIIMRDNWPC